MSQPIDFWFSIGSTYTYLTVMRLNDVAREAGVAFRWRPFDVRSIMIEMKNIPFSTKPVKARYMWRDLERRAVRHGVAWSGVPPYPLKDLAFANRLALVGAREGWCVDFVKAAYRRWFGSAEDVSTEPTAAEILQELGQDLIRVITLSNSDEVKRNLESETQAASALGIFGAPSFAVRDEIFWGDDRLEDAIAWSRHGPTTV
jgi:2-hydroxychromene-2-carboxylate isomerase